MIKKKTLKENIIGTATANGSPVDCVCRGFFFWETTHLGKSRQSEAEGTFMRLC